MTDIHFHIEECEKLFDPDTRCLKEEFRCETCPVCGGAQFVKKFTLRGLDYVRCARCKMVLVNPRPSDRLLKDFYNSPYYRSHVEKVEIPRILAGEKYYSLSLTEDGYKTAAGVLDHLDRETAILDIGCGTGAFSHYIYDKKGFKNVRGIEYGEAQIHFAEGRRPFPVTRDSTHDLAGRGDRFGLALLIEVVEHVNQIPELLEGVCGVLEPGGRVLITTPNVGTLASLLNGEFGSFYNAPNHLNYFSGRTLSLLMSRYGFRGEAMVFDQEKATTLSPRTLLYYHSQGREWRSPLNERDDQNHMVDIPKDLRKLGNRAVLEHLRSPEMMRSFVEYASALAGEAPSSHTPRTGGSALRTLGKFAKLPMTILNRLVQSVDQAPHVIGLFQRIR